MRLSRFVHATCVAAAATAAHAQPNVEPLPGTPLSRTAMIIAGPCGSGTTFDELGVPFINGTSTLAFHARESWCGPGSPIYGIYTQSSGGALTTIARASSDGSQQFTHLSVIPGINDLGDTSFRGTLTAGGTGIFARVNSVITQIAVDGQAAPGLAGFTFQGLGPDSVWGPDTRRVLIGNSRLIAFRAHAVSSDPPDGREGLWVWTPSGGLQLIIATGMLPPGALTEYPMWQLTDYDIDKTGRVAFQGGCPDPYPDDGSVTYHATWRGYPGSLALVDHVFAQFELSGPYNGGPFLNNSGIAGVHRYDEYVSDCFRDIQRFTGGAQFIIGGNAAPGATCLEWTSIDPCGDPLYSRRTLEAVSLGPAINDGNRGITRHWLYDRQTPDCENPATDGIWFWNTASSIPVVIDEQKLYDWTGDETEFVDTCISDTTEVAINNKHQSAFAVTSRRDSNIYFPFDYGTFIFGRSAGTPTVIRPAMREHDTLLLPGSTEVFTINNLAWGTGEVHRRDNPRSGHGIINDNGFIIYRADLYGNQGSSRQVFYRTKLP